MYIDKLRRKLTEKMKKNRHKNSYRVKNLQRLRNKVNFRRILLKS